VVSSTHSRISEYCESKYPLPRTGEPDSIPEALAQRESVAL
jgi:hypothetical protein